MRITAFWACLGLAAIGVYGSLSDFSKTDSKEMDGSKYMIKNIRTLSDPATLIALCADACVKLPDCLGFDHDTSGSAKKCTLVSANINIAKADDRASRNHYARRIDAPAKPTLTTSNSSPTDGGAVNLTCNATATVGSISYEFLKDGVNISTGDDTYAMANATIGSDDGSYTCVATVFVNLPPIINLV